MKITFEDVKTLNEEPLELFYHGIKADVSLIIEKSCLIEDVIATGENAEHN
ncbi:MAG: hypothetical protein ACR2LL_04240 [Nitrosopumilus sp.]